MSERPNLPPTIDDTDRLHTDQKAREAASKTDVFGDLGYSDIDNAERLAIHAQNVLRYVPIWDEWLVFDDGVWMGDKGGVLAQEACKQVARITRAYFEFEYEDGAPKVVEGNDESQKAHERYKAQKNHLRRVESRDGITAMLFLARSHPGFVTCPGQLDTHPWLFNCLNGTIDLRTGTLRSHNPDDLLTIQAPVIYDPQVVSSQWQQCLDTWQPDLAMQEYLARINGMALTGQAIEHLYLNVGRGQNGKSKFYEAVRHVLGDYAKTPHKSLLVTTRNEQHDTVKASLFRARMLICPETEQGDQLNEAQIKSLTGDDTVTARKMRGDEFSFDPTWSVFMHTNHKPRVRGTGKSMWRRLRLIQWNAEIEVADDTLKAKLATNEVKSTILNWLVAGCLMRQRLGGDAEPEQVQRDSKEYQQSEDVVGRFLEDRLGDWLAKPGESRTWAVGTEKSAQSLRQVWEDWCNCEGIKPWSTKQLAEQLRPHGFSNRESNGRSLWLRIR